MGVQVSNWTYDGDSHSLDHLVLFKEDGKIVLNPATAKPLTLAENSTTRFRRVGVGQRYDLFSAGKVSGWSAANGLTTDERLIFKRPKTLNGVRLTGHL